MSLGGTSRRHTRRAPRKFYFSFQHAAHIAKRRSCYSKYLLTMYSEAWAQTLRSLVSYGEEPSTTLLWDAACASEGGRPLVACNLSLHVPLLQWVENRSSIFWPMASIRSIAKSVEWKKPNITVNTHQRWRLQALQFTFFAQLRNGIKKTNHSPFSA